MTFKTAMILTKKTIFKLFSAGLKVYIIKKWLNFFLPLYYLNFSYGTKIKTDPDFPRKYSSSNHISTWQIFFEFFHENQY